MVGVVTGGGKGGVGEDILVEEIVYEGMAGLVVTIGCLRRLFLKIEWKERLPHSALIWSMSHLVEFLKDEGLIRAYTRIFNPFIRTIELKPLDRRPGSYDDLVG